MHCRRIIMNIYYRVLAKDITNIYQFNSRKSTFIMCLPKMHEIRRNYSRQFHKQEKSTQTKLIIISSSFLFNLFGSEEEKDDVSELEMTIKRSILLIQKGEFKKAEQMLHIALRQAQTLQHYDGITYIYDVMANLAYNLNDFKKAEKLFVSVMQRLISKGMAQDDLAIIHMSLKIANMYSKMGETEKAENGYQFCLESLKKHMAKDSENPDVLQLMGLALEWYGGMLFSESRYVDALRYLTEAYDISVKMNGIEDEQTVVLLSDLGTVNCAMKEYDEAIKYLTKATEIGKKLPDMFDIGSIYVNLGNAYIIKGLYEEAKKNCKQGKQLAKAQNHDESLKEAEKCLERIKELMS